MSRILLACAFAQAALLPAQPAAEPALPTTFEVAAIKPSKANDNNSSANSTNARITMTNLTLRQIVLYAFTLQEHQLVAPAWLADERYNVDAKAETSVGGKQLTVMMQTLLADRCKMVIHRETKSMSGFALTVAKSGLKIQPAGGEGSGMSTNNTKLTATHADMDRLTVWLGRLLNQPVVNDTGVTGSFDFELEYQSPRLQRTDGANEKEPSLPTIFTALQEKLGLKLESRKVPVEVIVVDSIERPSDN
jgi:uncharacterized protein (TIGR03435 family)